MRDAGLIHLIDAGVWQTGWNVDIQPAFAAEHGIRYLSRYVFKVAISDHRVVDTSGGKVTFSYRKPKSRRTRLMQLDASEFMRWFLEHTLPAGFMKVRYYGFMHPCSGVPLEKVRATIEMMHGFDVPDIDPKRGEPVKASRLCPDCGCDLRYLYSVLPHQMPLYRGPG